MDSPDLPPDEHLQAMRGLVRLNRISGVASAMYRPIQRACAARNRVRKGTPIRLLDVASGGGDLPLSWAKFAKREGLNLEVTTVDACATAIRAQRASAEAGGVTVEILQLDCLNDRMPTGFDIVTCSLFMHQLERRQAVCLLQSMQRCCTGMLLVCDLNRSRLNWAMAALASRLVSRSGLLHHDSTARVRAAYTMQEFGELAGEALNRPVKLRHSLPCRFILRVDEVTVPAEDASTSVAFA